MSQDVHSRLYQRTLEKDKIARREVQEREEERQRKQEFMLRSFSEHRHSVSLGLTSGNRMYTKGIKMIENKDREITQEKAKREHEEIKDCTFKPKLLTKKSDWSKNEQKRRSLSQMDAARA